MELFTVGNPRVYDENLRRGKLCKAPGGAVFLRREEAEAAIADGHLPAAWGLEDLPGAVYVLDAALTQVVGPPDEVGALRLASRAPIIAKVVPAEVG